MNGVNKGLTTQKFKKPKKIQEFVWKFNAF